MSWKESAISFAYIPLYYQKNKLKMNNGILLTKFFLPAVRKNRSSDREKLSKLEAEGWEFAKCLRSPEQCIQTVKGQDSFWQQIAF